MISQTIDFTDSSIGATQWLWDFGDGEEENPSTSTEQNPSHTYTAVGEYTVVLTVSNQWGSDTITQYVEIVENEYNVLEEQPEEEDVDEEAGNPIVQINLVATLEDGWYYYTDQTRAYVGLYHLHQDGTAMIGGGVLGVEHEINPDEVLIHEEYLGTHTPMPEDMEK